MPGIMVSAAPPVLIASADIDTLNSLPDEGLRPQPLFSLQEFHPDSITSPGILLYNVVMIPVA